VDAYFTGVQRLEDNPHRSQSEPYLLFGGLIERRFGRVRLLVNAESLGGVRQTGSIRWVRFRRRTDDGPSMSGHRSMAAPSMAAYGSASESDVAVCACRRMQADAQKLDWR